MNVYLISEVANQLRCSRGAVINLIRSGRLKANNIGSKTRHSYRITQAQLEAFQRGHLEVDATPPVVQLTLPTKPQLQVKRFMKLGS